MKPRALDTFCGAGGVTVGLQRAGFHVTGVDNRPQPRYPGECFRIADALKYIEQHGREYDFIWASPPCQAYSAATAQFRSKKMFDYPDLVDATRSTLKATGIPWVIENVMGSPLARGSVRLCGLSFGLRVFRHRYFESNFHILVPSHVTHKRGATLRGEIFSVFGKRGSGGSFGSGNGVRYRKGSISQWKQAMGIDWMTCEGLSQAIPPAYSEFIGRQFLGSHGLN